ncbi:MAG TPA: hypothetical protein EYN73_10230 [Chromatiaceae bacterium]|jgi:hypothetical protein|nr:hypothetical protein [Chromatiaceae bacterium]HIA09423.1 hypothetical protein [Chromatiaceae bacterium]HIB85337.1 hypothetical protein [Chromatiaceae bacterium]HIO13625.1 hypothetical protein [Chromatiales bacterium]HIO54803.1 hypothetical protein [Chromatiales bacterium]
MYKLVITSLALLLTSIAVSAKGLPENYPAQFDHSGSIGRIDVNSGYIVIQDTQFRLPQNIMVHTPNGKKQTAHRIKVGARVGALIDRSRPSMPIVTDLWILPKNHPGLLPPY